jgi:hypothetical protein
MTSINSVQGSPNLAQLLAAKQASQTTANQPTQASSPATDTLSLSNAALQALQGLDPTQLLQSQASATYQAQGHHRHHHRSGSLAQTPIGQSDANPTATQVPVIGATDGSALQTKA